MLLMSGLEFLMAARAFAGERLSARNATLAIGRRIVNREVVGRREPRRPLRGRRARCTPTRRSRATAPASSSTSGPATASRSPVTTCPSVTSRVAELVSPPPRGRRVRRRGVRPRRRRASPIHKGSTPRSSSDREAVTPSITHDRDHQGVGMNGSHLRKVHRVRARRAWPRSRWASSRPSAARAAGALLAVGALLGAVLLLVLRPPVQTVAAGRGRRAHQPR